MADFVAVLKKTIEGLSENTPERREKIYAKARSTIDAKLASIQPPPPAAVAERQRQAIEDAIRAVETQYAPAEPEADDQLDDFFASFDQTEPSPVAEAEPEVGAERAQPVMPEAETPQVDAAPVDAPAEPDDAGTDDQPDEPSIEEEVDFSRVDEVDDRPADEGEDEDANRNAAGDDDRLDLAARHDSGLAAAPAPAKERPRFSRKLIAAVLALLVLGGGAYAVWLNQDSFSSVAGLSDDDESVEPTDPAEVAEGTDMPDEAALEAEADIAEGEAAPDSEEEAAGAAPDAPADQQTAAATTPPQKFTQRLQPDGTEIDAGPAGGQNGIGEGTSVAELTQAAQQAQQEAAEGQDDPAASAASGDQPASAPDAAAAAVPVGQRAIFYEERTQTEAASADSGSIVWSLIQESPGGDAPAEPAIRAEATIPGKDIQLRMTIRRNTDPTLPAGHIMEMIFLTPEGFEGGGIQNVVRVALKSTEESTGSPLLGIPARIADGFFLVALSDSPAEIQANLNLLSRQNWIDIPLVYNSGRRALITIEKGIPGDRVFDEAVRAWREAGSG